MVEHDISGLAVLDLRGALVGVVTRSDLLRVATADPRAVGVLVRQAMTSPAVTADPTMLLSDAAQLMSRAHVRRLVVVEAGEAYPCGVLSQADLVRALAPR